MSDLTRCEVEALIAHQGRHIDVARRLVDELMERVRLLEVSLGDGRWVVDWYQPATGVLRLRKVCRDRAEAAVVLMDAVATRNPRDCDLEVICAHVVTGLWSDLAGGVTSVETVDVWRSGTG